MKTINNKSIDALALSLLIMLLIACGNPSNTPCHNNEELVEKSINAINNKNSKEYISLIDFNKLSEIWENAAIIDNDYTEMSSTLKDNKNEVIKSYARSYNMLIGTMEKIHKLNDWQFEIRAFELKTTERAPGYAVENYTVKLEDSRNNYNKWTLNIYLTKYNDCYYIAEPLDPYNLKKGW